MESSSAMGMDLTTRLICGGTAGCVARTFVAPIDRVKLLLQTQHVTYKGATRYSGVIGTMRGVMAEEGGLSALWRGNGVNCVRVFPYAATQFASFDFFKQLALDLKKSGSAEGERSSASRSRKRPRHWEGTGRGSGNDRRNARAKPTISVLDRLVCGGLAGATATTLTHPLDVVRLRLAVSSKQELSGPWSAVRSILREGGARALYKGYVPTIISLAPFIAINFSAFDTIKAKLRVAELPAGQKQAATLLGGAAAGTLAQSICFPLDVVRRRMQLNGTAYRSVAHALPTIVREEGVRGLYKGMLPNVVKIVPNAGIRFLAYDTLKGLLDM